ncbi:unannotated protein [freshwater metagenome]|uniref:Unannotated protein n=1 Tax=freshwater metagenome TaxID=449393 RepID=A0A6J6RR89_9ZZZZ
MGSGANNTCRYLGAACGITLFVTIATHDGLAPAQLVQGWNHAVVSAVAITLLGALAVLVAGREPGSAHSAVVRPAR